MCRSALKHGMITETEGESTGLEAEQLGIGPRVEEDVLLLVAVVGAMAGLAPASADSVLPFGARQDLLEGRLPDAAHRGQDLARGHLSVGVNDHVDLAAAAGNDPGLSVGNKGVGGA